MSRLLIVLVALTTSLVAPQAVLTSAGTTLNTIGSTGQLTGNGHAVRGAVLIECTAGEQVQVTLTLIQGHVSGIGQGAGLCTGSLTEYEVTVPAGPGDTFQPGFAKACATAMNRSQGEIVDTREWCRAAPMKLVPQ